MIPARISIVTIGTRDFAAMREFYRSLGWREASSSEEHSMFDTAGGVLSLFPSDELAKDADVDTLTAPGAYSNFSLAINLESRELVDQTFAHLRELGVTITKEPHETFWGGYSGYFADPENNLWEIAWNPYVRFDSRGALDMNISV